MNKQIYSSNTFTDGVAALLFRRQEQRVAASPHREQHQRLLVPQVQTLRALCLPKSEPIGPDNARLGRHHEGAPSQRHRHAVKILLMLENLFQVSRLLECIQAIG